MLKTKVAVVGSGPVGLFTSLLLQHFQIDFQNF
jgi:2-polyprenyl-6-methoxyphenol hydroxylase-like FAD-dependent oxidoreductase